MKGIDSVGINKSGDYLLIKTVPEIKYIIGDRKPVANRSRVSDIVERTAGVGLFYADILVIVELHSYARAIISRVFYQKRSD